MNLRAVTLPGIMLRDVELLVSPLLSCAVALLVEGTEDLSLKTRVISTTTDPLLQVWEEEESKPLNMK